MQRRHFTEVLEDTSPPSDAPPAEADSASTATASTADSETTSASSASKRPDSASGTVATGVRPKPDEAPLPPGWDFSYSDKGRIFFIDHINKTTSWVDPRTGKASPMPALDFESRIGPLPVRSLFTRTYTITFFKQFFLQKTTGWLGRASSHGRSHFLHRPQPPTHAMGGSASAEVRRSRRAILA